MPSLTGYRSLSCWQIKASSASRYSSGPLHLGQTRISSNCGATGMRISVVGRITKAAECRCILSPILQYFHPKVEIHAATCKCFDLFPSSRPQELDTASLFANEDALLAFAFDVNYCSNVDRRAVLPKLLDLTSDAVRYLSPELLQCSFSYQFRGEEANGMYADVFDREQERAFGEVSFDCSDQRRKTITSECRDEERVWQGIGEGCAFVWTEQIRFI